MGTKKLATIREELRAAFAAEGSNPIASLDRKIRKLKKNSKSADKELRSLLLLRDALVQVVEDKPQKRLPSRRRERSKKTV
jgi:hypothetical protein